MLAGHVLDRPDELRENGFSMSVMMSPSVCVVRSFNDQGDAGRPIAERSRGIDRPFARVRARATEPARTRLTVAVETPARRATSPMVAVISTGSRPSRSVRKRLCPLGRGEGRQLLRQLVELLATTHLAVRLLGVDLAAHEVAADAPARQDGERVADRQRVLNVVMKITPRPRLRAAMMWRSTNADCLTPSAESARRG